MYNLNIKVPKNFFNSDYYINSPYYIKRYFKNNNHNNKNINSENEIAKDILNYDFNNFTSQNFSKDEINLINLLQKPISITKFPNDNFEYKILNQNKIFNQNLNKILNKENDSNLIQEKILINNDETKNLLNYNKMYLIKTNEFKKEKAENDKKCCHYFMNKDLFHNKEKLKNLKDNYKNCERNLNYINEKLYKNNIEKRKILNNNNDNNNYDDINNYIHYNNDFNNLNFYYYLKDNNNNNIYKNNYNNNHNNINNENYNNCINNINNNNCDKIKNYITFNYKRNKNLKKF